mgnify:CR=1 FL=1
MQQGDLSLTPNHLLNYREQKYKRTSFSHFWLYCNVDMMLVHDLAGIPYQVDKYLFYLLFVCNQAQRNVGKREV